MVLPEHQTGCKDNPSAKVQPEMLELGIVRLTEFQAEEESPVSLPCQIVASAANIILVASNRLEEFIFSLYVPLRLVQDCLRDG